MTIKTYHKRTPKSVGKIIYNSTTGAVKTVEITDKFWNDAPLPDTMDCTKYLIKEGYGLIRHHTVQFLPN